MLKAYTPYRYIFIKNFDRKSVRILLEKQLIQPNEKYFENSMNSNTSSEHDKMKEISVKYFSVDLPFLKDGIKFSFSEKETKKLRNLPHVFDVY